MIVSLMRPVYFSRLKAENTAVTKAGHGIGIYTYCWTKDERKVVAMLDCELYK